MKEYKYKGLLRFCIVILLLFFNTIILFSFSDDEDGNESLPEDYEQRIVKIKLSKRSRVAWARLYINGKYYGKIRRSYHRTLNLNIHQRYIFSVERVFRGVKYFRERSVYLRKSYNIKWIYLKPKKIRYYITKGRLKIKMSGRSRVAYSYLFINNNPFGKIRRGETRTFRLTTERFYIIKLKRIWKGRLFIRRRRIRLYEKETKRIVLKPIYRRF